MSRTTLAGLAKRSPWGFVGMVVLVLIVEAVIDGRAQSLFDMEDIAFRWTGRAATLKARQAQVLCFGDSLIKLGVIPSVVAERTGKKVYNLALSGSQAPTSYFLLKRALDSGARPEAVVVDFTPPLLRVGPRHITTRWGAMLNPVEAAELAWWARDADLFGEVALGHWIPSLRGKTTIRKNLREALAGGKPDTLAWNQLAVRNWNKNEGAQLMVGSTAAQNLPDAEIQRLREGYYPEWACHRANSEGIDHFLKLAEQHKIQVYWVLAPVITRLQDQMTRSGIDARHDEFLRSWQARYPNLVILDARGKVPELDAFWDPQHLSVVGASAFSRTLGDVLRQSLEKSLRPSWVAMPEIKVGPLAPGVENIIESRLALDASSQIRK